VGLATPAVKSSQDAADERPERRSPAPYLVLALYLLGAIYVTSRLWADPARLAQNGDLHDVDQMAWFMRYSELAIVHFHLPALVTSAMNAPHTVNLMWNTSLLLPGVIMSPVTFIWGPQVTLNVLLTLGFAGSAAAMYFVLRRWGARISSAALGGALYGFSPAMTGSGIGHYHLVLAMVPPLMIDAILRIVTGRGSPVRNGLWLGGLAAAQFFIGEEALIDTAIAAVVLLVVLIACRPKDVPGRLRPSLIGGGAAAVTALVLCARGLWVQFHGFHSNGAYNVVSHHGQLTHLYTIPYTFVVPSDQVLLRTGWTENIVRNYPQPTPEYLAYLGPLLVIVLLAAGVRYWRLLPVRVAFLTFVVLEIFSLGAQPIGPYPGAALPWHWIQNLPMMSSTLPDRLSLLADGAAAAVLAFALDQFRARSVAANRKTWQQPAFVGLAVAIIAMLPLFPVPYSPGVVGTAPGGYTHAIEKLNLPDSATVLVVPVPNGAVTWPLRWYAAKSLPAHMIGGDFIDASARGRTSRSGRAAETPLTQYLDALWDRSDDAGPGPSLAAIRAQMAAWKPAGIVAYSSPTSPLGAYLIKIFGQPTVLHGSVMAWKTDSSWM
jgi:hypothetical protein